MSQEIINVLNYFGEQLGIVIDWSSENVWPQVMDILGRYRLMEIIKLSLWMVLEFCVLLSVMIVFVKIVKAYKAISKTKESNFWWERNYNDGFEFTFDAVGLIILSAIAGVVFLLTFATDINEMLKWVVVPEIKYLEMLKGLMA